MQTLTGYKKLTSWKNTKNRTNINTDDKKEKLIKDLYVDFFTGISNYKFDVRNNYITNFCGNWTKYNDSFHKKFVNAIKKVCNNLEEVELIWMKFKGNCGEIFAEKYFTRGLCKYIDTTKLYDTIDPNNEDFSDAKATAQDGYPVDIQIKNWMKDINFEVFHKAVAQVTISFNKYFKKNPNMNHSEYWNDIRGIVFSTTHRIKNKAMDQNSWLETGFIKFYGPDDIDDSFKNFTLVTINKFFNEIVNEIN